MTNLSSRAAWVFVYPILKANPCNEIRCQQGPVKGGAGLCASRHRHVYSTEGNALAARRTAKGFFHLILTVTSSSPLTNKKKQPLSYRGNVRVSLHLFYSAPNPKNRILYARFLIFGRFTAQVQPGASLKLTILTNRHRILFGFSL